MKILLIGHSHIRALTSAAREYPRPDLSIDSLSLLDARYWRDDAVAFDLVREDALAAGADADAVALIPWGNEPIALGLVAHDRPFDFILPRDEAGGLMPEHEIVPVALVRKTLDRMTLPGLYELFSGLFNCAVLVLSTPPPIQDDDYIVDHPGTARQMIAGKRVNAPEIRLKIWRLYCSVVQDRCDKAGFKFVNVAAANVTADGFLHPHALNGDATHGNAWYGDNMLQHFLEEVSTHA